MDRRDLQTVGRDGAQLFLIVRKAAAGTAQRVSRTHDQRITDGIRKGHRFFHRVHDITFRHRLLDLLHQVTEELTVFGLVDGFQVGSQDLDAVFLQDAGIGQFDDEIESGLSAQGTEHGIRAFFVDDAAGKVQRQRLDIDPVRDRGIGHDRRRVGVDQDDLIALLAQRLAGLAARIVELGRLTDDDRSGSDHQNLMYICTLCHLFTASFSISSIN